MVGAFRETGKIPVYRGFQAGHYLFAGWGQSPGCEPDGTSPTGYFFIFRDGQAKKGLSARSTVARAITAVEKLGSEVP
jgi:hypothetical protein